MSLFNVFKISGSAMSAQSLRLNTVASNLANADSVVSSDGKPYQSKQVVFKAVQDAANKSSTVEVDRVIEDTKPGKMVYDPKHPMACWPAACCSPLHSPKLSGSRISAIFRVCAPTS